LSASTRLFKMRRKELQLSGAMTTTHRVLERIS
jgi:hypothetical protein